MKKCTLSRIKSYEEKHYIKSFINRQNSYNDSVNLYNINNKNNKIGISLKHLSANDKKSKKIKENRQINTFHKRFNKNKDKNNEDEGKNKNITLKDIPKNFSEPKKLLSRRQNTYFIQKKRISLLNKYSQNHLVSTGNTSGEIDINDNEDLNEFYSEENKFTINGHITNLTNIYNFPQYFESKKIIIEKESGIDKNRTKIEKTTMKIREECVKNKDNFGNNFWTNDSIKKNKCIQKLNFAQPNKNINLTKNHKDPKKVINGINTKIKNENNKISSYNNKNKINYIIKNLIKKNIFRITKNSYSNNCYIN